MGSRNWREIGITALPEKKVYDNCTIMPVRITVGDFLQVAKAVTIGAGVIALIGGYAAILIHEVSKLGK